MLYSWLLLKKQPKQSVLSLAEQKQSMSNIYTDGQYAEDNPSWHKEDSPFKALQIFRMIQRNGRSPQSVAEIGCGVGGVLRELQQSLPDDVQFNGYDIAETAIERANQHSNDRLAYVCQDLLESEECFDLLLIIDVIEHIPDCLGFTRQCKEHAIDKIFHIPLDIHASSVVRGTVNSALESSGHIQYFTAETALATLQNAGHEIIDYSYTDGSIALAKLHPGLKRTIANLPRRFVGMFSEKLSARFFGGYSLLVLTR